jgi:hypothetical protein
MAFEALSLFFFSEPLFAFSCLLCFALMVVSYGDLLRPWLGLLVFCFSATLSIALLFFIIRDEKLKLYLPLRSLVMI